MYAEFFGFRELPFNNTPDPRFFYSTPDYEEALATLIYTVRERKGFVLLTGETGTGKTLVTRMMLRHFGTRLAFATVHHAVRTPEDLLESICTEFELSVPEEGSSTQLVRILHDYLLTQFARNLPVVLVLDEAQNLSVEGFELLRQLGNLEADDMKLLQIVIVGQPELRKLFASPHVRQLRQRLFRSFHLPALSPEHTAAYIRHRLKVVADQPEKLFEDSAIEAVYRHTGGLPRLINTLCDNAMLSAYAANQKCIDCAAIDSVAEPMLLGAPLADLPAVGREGGESGMGKDQWPLSKRRGVAVANSYEVKDQEDIEARGPSRSNATVGAAALLNETPFGGSVERATKTVEVPAADAWRGIIRRDVSAVVRELRQSVGQIAARLTELECRGHITPAELVEARSVLASLSPMVRQAREIAARSETTTGILQHREQTLSRLTGVMQGAVRDLRALLDRVGEATAETIAAERSARRTMELLQHRVEERSSCVVEDALAAPSTHSSTAPGRGRIDLTSQRWNRTGSQTHSEEHLRQELASARESLSGLRLLSSPRDCESAAPARGSKESPTDRLARSVDQLLEAVLPEKPV